MARSVAALVAVSGMAVALFFAVGPIRITVREQVGVVQAIGREGTGLTVTDQMHDQVSRVTCVPLMRYDTSSDVNSACGAHTTGPLRVAAIGFVLFLVGSAVWILSGGDRAMGLSGRRAYRPGDVR